MSAGELAGRVFSHYRVLEQIGAGGMGVVYRARDETLGREVVLKLLPDDLVGDADARRRLLEEGRKAAALNHPGICTIHEVGESEGRVYVAMERIEGATLEARLQPRGLPVETVVALGVQIADALAHAHDRGIVHRDLKSANVIVTPEGRAKVLDFGIARRIDPVTHATVPGTTVTALAPLAGTWHALPPEALRGERADARGDVWALGILFHEMLTGERPFQGHTEYELAAAILNAEPATLPASVPARLRSVIQRCLAKDPAGRFQRASEVRAVLEMLRAERPAGPVTATTGARAGGARRLALMTGGVLALVAVLIAAGLALRGGALRPRTIRSLAVLPLENLSGDREQEYFADGMTDELITSLASLSDVRVISRTSAMRYRGTTKSVPQIARELGVDAVVEGTALRAGNQVRITAQLIDGATDRHLWARSYERDLVNVLVLQGEVAQAIATEIRASIRPSARARLAHRGAIDPATYELYLKGRYLWNRRSSPALRESIRLFQRAIARDSNYAAAHAGLAEAWAVIGPYVNLPPRDTYPRARDEAMQALALDPGLGQAHATLAMVKYFYDYDWAGAEAEFQKAFEVEPGYAGAHQYRAAYLTVMGRLDEAAKEADIARRLDPLSLIIRLSRARIDQYAGRYDQALAGYRELLDLDPAFQNGHFWLGRCYGAQGKYREWVEEQAAADSLDGAALAYTRALRVATKARGKEGFWAKRLELERAQSETTYVAPSVLAECYAQRGDLERSFQAFERGIREHDPYWQFLLRDWALAPLRADPRYAALMRETGLAP